MKQSDFDRLVADVRALKSELTTMKEDGVFGEPATASLPESVRSNILSDVKESVSELNMVVAKDFVSLKEEVASQLESLSLQLSEQPALVKAVEDKVTQARVDLVSKIASVESVVASLSSRISKVEGLFKALCAHLEVDESDL